MKNKSRYFLAELLGSCFLVMIIVGSGLMAENNVKKYDFNTFNMEVLTTCKECN